MNRRRRFVGESGRKRLQGGADGGLGSAMDFAGASGGAASQAIASSTDAERPTHTRARTMEVMLGSRVVDVTRRFPHGKPIARA